MAIATTRLYHPHVDTFEDVPDAKVKEWVDAGWRKTPLDNKKTDAAPAKS